MSKIVKSLKEVIKLCGLKNGMTISFHHHLRNGDYVLNTILEVVAEIGIKDLTLAASAFFPVHKPVIEHIKNEVITGIDTNYMIGPLAEAVSDGILEKPVIFRSHGGRARAIHDGNLKIDVAFIAAPSADEMGNISGVLGKSACGSLGYAMPDAIMADKVVAVTDNCVDFPISPISIDQTQIDYVVIVPVIGDPKGIVSGTTKITRDPIGLLIAKNAADVIEASGLLVDGFSFQTGAGGTSLAVAHYIRDKMKRKKICGSFGMGGITGYFVKMFNDGLFKKLIDVQCFDLDAVKSLSENPDHLEVSASFYANPHAKSCAVDKLDSVILGATEIDVEYNVNVLTNSNGRIMGGSGGHCDTSEGAKLTIIVANLLRARIPIIVDKVLTKVTKGNTVDVLVTERGIAVNPSNKKLWERLKASGLSLMSIEELKSIAEKLAGKPEKIKMTADIIGEVEYRDGSRIDVVRKPLQ
ncbi:Citrate lyase alpha chain [subsurface metagenome]